ncbi:MAG: glycosyltransferase family 4 protein [Patescibacteria group bacterium]|nr:glycosyltransferase family 4 protein [Patescibacteria group bacterium]
MKISQIVCAFPPYAGGIGQSAYRLGEILSREHQVNTFTLIPSNEKTPPKTSYNQRVHFLRPNLRSGHGALPFSLLLKLFPSEIIYLHYPFFGTDALILLFCSVFKKKRLFIHYHMDTPALPGNKKMLSIPSRLIFKKLMKRAEKIIVGSRDYAENGKLSKIYQEFPEKIKIIPFGVESDVFKPKITADKEAKQRLATDIVNFVNRRFIKRGGHTLLFVGGLDSAHYFKGLNILIEAISTISLPFSLNIIGDGDLKKQYQQQVAKFNLNKKVNFLGRVSEEELIRQYQNADVLLLPSINSHEAFGLVLIEAMACGLPVIASNLIGVRSVFTNGREGLICEPGKVKDLNEKILSLISDEGKRLEMSRAARKLVEEKYAWEKVADQILDEFSTN